jgi:hypothetical protein
MRLRHGQRALRMGNEYPRIFLGWSYEQRGIFNEAILELQKVVVGRGDFRMDPRLRSLQSGSRLQELLRRMNFPQDRQ